MSFMEKFQAQIERILVPLASKLNSQRHICSVRDAFINNGWFINGIN